jgi:hypothetical protein
MSTLAQSSAISSTQAAITSNQDHSVAPRRRPTLSSSERALLPPLPLTAKLCAVPSRFLIANDCMRWRAVMGATAQRQQRWFVRLIPHRWDKVAAEERRRRATALGLLQVLTTANIADDATLKKAIAFCDEQGVTSVSDLVEYDLADDFVFHLGLKYVHGRKLCAMLQTLSCSC